MPLTAVDERSTARYSALIRAVYRDETPLGILMHDFACSDPGDMRYKLLADRARYLKESKEGIKSMCRAMEEMRNETRLEQKKKSALKMLMAGKLSYEEIADYQELSLDEVEELASELSRLATV